MSSEWMITNNKLQYGRKHLWPKLRPGGSKGNCETPQSGYPTPLPKLKLDTFIIQV
jgi:hypothetical protein